MFGLGWEPAVATIVARRLVAQGHGGEAGILSWQQFEYIADVKPDGRGRAFRATIEEPRNGIHFQAPDVGQVVRVKFHAKDKHVKFDGSDPGIRRDQGHRQEDKAAVAAAHSKEAQARFDEIAKAAPGTAPPTDVASAAPSSGSADLSGLADMTAAFAEVREAMAGLSTSTTDFSETIEAIKRARASGDLAEVERLKAEYQQREGQGPS